MYISLFFDVFISVHTQDSRRPRRKRDWDAAFPERIRLKSSRKLNCEAIMQIRCIRVFSDYHVDKGECPTANSLTMTKRMLREINGKLHTFASMSRYYVKLPLCSTHTGHPIGETSTIVQKINKRLEEKIYELVHKNITRPSEVQRLPKLYVEESLFAGRYIQ